MLQRIQNNVRAARKNEGGFTLIELLIVIVILGILAGITVFSVQFINSRGTTAACQTDKKNVEVAIEAYYAQQGKYPTDIDDSTHTNPDTLVGLGVLKEKPSSKDYSITYDATKHSVVSSGC